SSFSRCVLPETWGRRRAVAGRLPVPSPHHKPGGAEAPTHRSLPDDAVRRPPEGGRMSVGNVRTECRSDEASCSWLDGRGARLDSFHGRANEGPLMRAVNHGPSGGWGHRPPMESSVIGRPARAEKM